MKRILNAITSASRELFRRWGALLILFLLYLAMLGAIYLFFVSREATIGQLILSLLLALAVPVLFLVIQTMAARYNAGDVRAMKLFGGSLRDFWKLLLISIPLIIVAVLAIYLFAKSGTTPPATVVRDAARATPLPQRPAAPKTAPVQWQSVVLTTLQYLLFCLVLPLAAIHLWIVTAREGLQRAFKGFVRILARAFAPSAVIAYAVGFVIFAIIPWFLVVTRTSAASPWLDVTLLVLRLALAALFSLVGWVITIGALGKLSRGGDSQGVVAPTSESAGHVPAEA